MAKEFIPSISRMARTHGVSRQAIYTFLDAQDFAKDDDGRYTVTKEMVEAVEERFSQLGKTKKEVNKTLVPKKIPKDKQVIKPKKIDISNNLTFEEISTMSMRLGNLKQEYNYNKELITKFQEEIEVYQKEYGTTLIVSHNGSATLIPQVVQLKNFIELNLRVSKQITELETILKLDGEEDEDPFA